MYRVIVSGKVAMQPSSSSEGNVAGQHHGPRLWGSGQRCQGMSYIVREVTTYRVQLREQSVFILNQYNGGISYIDCDDDAY